MVELIQERFGGRSKKKKGMVMKRDGNGRDLGFKQILISDEQQGRTWGSSKGFKQGGSPPEVVLDCPNAALLPSSANEINSAAYT